MKEFSKFFKKLQEISDFSLGTLKLGMVVASAYYLFAMVMIPISHRPGYYVLSQRVIHALFEAAPGVVLAMLCCALICDLVIRENKVKNKGQ